MEATYKQTAKEARLKILDLIFNAQTSHIGSNFSCIDLMTVLFQKIDLDKDRIVLSAGWKAATLYFFLWKKGRITEEQLNSYCKEGSPFIGLAEPMHPDIPVAGGSMGLGLPMAVGLALAKKIKKEAGTIYVLMSDGEMDIGTTWESALIASQNNLDNLVVILDNNGFQAMGKKDNILTVNIASLFSGWNKAGVDGHSFEAISNLMTGHFMGFTGPKLIDAKTIKGKGVSFMEGNNIWHYKAPNEDEYIKAKKELCQI